MNKISLIVAMDQNRGIGFQNKLPWHLPADLKHFRNITLGHTIMMGRKTYESIGKPLPDRRNIVISRQENLSILGCEVVHSIEEGLALAGVEKDIFIIGGAEIFNQAMGLVERMYITQIHAKFKSDTLFPEIRPGAWQVAEEKHHEPDEKNHYAYSFLLYEKVF